MAVAGKPPQNRPQNRPLPLTMGHLWHEYHARFHLRGECGRAGCKRRGASDGYGPLQRPNWPAARLYTWPKHGSKPLLNTCNVGWPRSQVRKCASAARVGFKLEDEWPESIFPQVLIQPRRHLLTSLRRACLRAAMLSVYGRMRAPSHHPTFLSNCAARFLTKAVCASCIVPGCCAQVALCKLLRASALCKLVCASALSKLLCASALRQLLRASALRMCSAQVGLCKLLCACSVQVALRKCSEQVALRRGSAPVAPCKRFAHVLCASWSVQVALRKCFVQLLCASCSAQDALRK